MRFHLTLGLIVLGIAQGHVDCEPARAGKIEQANRPSEAAAKNKMTEFDLPEGVKPTDEVREEIRDEKGEVSYQIITVADKLKDLGAVSSGGRLVDRNGREIKFYRPPVRGASQGFEADQEQSARDAEELRKLKEKYTVVVLYINPLKVM